MLVFDRPAREWQQSQGAPSLSIAVLRRGMLLHAAGYGAGAPETVYQSASLGKHFTAALALVLSASGEGPALDTPVARYLPEFPEPWRGITLRNLLSHTAGIPGSGYDSLDFERDYTDSEIVSAISQGGPIEFQPGTAWRYSNAGYVLAGIAIGRSTGTFYGDLLQNRIFRPLGMTTATVTLAGAPVGYIREGGQLVPAAYVSPTLNRLADGGLCLSALDWVRWDAALCGDWSVRVGEMFRETRLESGLPSGYGLGWSLSSGEHGRVAEHDGGWQGFSTAMVRYLDEGVSAVVLANIADADAAGLAHELAAAGLDRVIT